MNRVRDATRLLLPNWSPHPDACVAALRRSGYLGAIPGDLLELIRLHFPDAWRDHAANNAKRKAQLAAILHIDPLTCGVPRSDLRELFKNIDNLMQCYIKIIERYIVIYCGDVLAFIVLSTGELHKRVIIGHNCNVAYAGMGIVCVTPMRCPSYAVSADCAASFNITGSAPEYIFPCGLILVNGSIVHPINRSSVTVGQDNEVNMYIRRCWGHDCYGLYDCSPKFIEIKLV